MEKIGKEFYRSIARSSGSTSSSTAKKPRIWKERLLETLAASTEVRGSRLFQLASVDRDGAPACRTVVFRGWYSQSKLLVQTNPNNAIKFITDARSLKLDDFSQNSRVEVVWWFVSLSEQYRIKGHVQVIDGTAEGEEAAAREKQWKELSPTARSQFAWPDPGEPFSERDHSTTSNSENELSPPENFVMCLIWPTRVKYLNLSTGSLAQDDICESHPAFPSESSEWSCTLVNP